MGLTYHNASQKKKDNRFFSPLYFFSFPFSLFFVPCNLPHVCCPIIAVLVLQLLRKDNVSKKEVGGRERKKKEAYLVKEGSRERDFPWEAVQWERTDVLIEPVNAYSVHLVHRRHARCIISAFFLKYHHLASHPPPLNR